ncbi:MAG: LEPR-XLL domain-containing protein, partial [Betaproteobacteria bacterium]
MAAQPRAEVGSKRGSLSRALKRAFGLLKPRALGFPATAARTGIEFESLEPRLLLSADLPLLPIAALAAQAEQHHTPPAEVSRPATSQPPAINFASHDPKAGARVFAGQVIHLDIDAAQDVSDRGPAALEHDDRTATLGGNIELTKNTSADYADRVQLGALLFSPNINFAAAPGAALDASLKITDINGKQVLQLVDNESGAMLRQEALDADVKVTVTGGDLN